MSPGLPKYLGAQIYWKAVALQTQPRTPLLRRAQSAAWEQDPAEFVHSPMAASQRPVAQSESLPQTARQPQGRRVPSASSLPVQQAGSAGLASGQALRGNSSIFSLQDSTSRPSPKVRERIGPASLAHPRDRLGISADTRPEAEWRAGSRAGPARGR